MSIKSIVIRNQERFNSSSSTFDHSFNESFEEFRDQYDEYEEGSWYVRAVSAGSNVTCSSESVFSSADEQEDSDSRRSFTRSLSAESDEIFQDSSYTLKLLSRRDSSDSGRGRGSWSSSPRSKSVPTGGGRESSDEGPPKDNKKRQESAPERRTRITIRASNTQPSQRPRERSPSPQPISRHSARRDTARERRGPHCDIELRSSPVSVPFQENQRITAHTQLSAADDHSDASSIFSSKSGDTVVHKVEPKVDRRKSSAYIALSKPPAPFQPPQLSLSPPSTPQQRKRVKTEITKVTTYKTNASNENLGRWIAVDTSSPRVSVEDLRYRRWTDGNLGAGKGFSGEKGVKTKVAESTDYEKGQTAHFSKVGSDQVPFFPPEEKLNTLRVRSRSQSSGKRVKEERIEQHFQKDNYSASLSRNASVPVARRTERPDFHPPVYGQHARVPLKEKSFTQPQGLTFSWVDGGQISDGYQSDCSSVRQTNTNVILGRSDIAKSSVPTLEFSSTGSLSRSQTLPRSYKGPVFRQETEETRVKTVTEKSTRHKSVADENNRYRTNFRPIEPSPVVQNVTTPSKATPINGNVKLSDTANGVVVHKSRDQSSSNLRVTEVVSKERSLSEVRRYSRVSREDLSKEEIKASSEVTDVESGRKQVKQKKKKKEKRSKSKKKEAVEEKSEEIKQREVEAREREFERKKREKEHLVNEFKRLAKLDSEAEEDFTLRKSYSLQYRVKQKESVFEAPVIEKEVVADTKEPEESLVQSVPSIEELKKTNLSFDERIKEQRRILLDQIEQKRDSIGGSNTTSHSLDLSVASETEQLDGGWQSVNSGSYQRNPPVIHITPPVNNNNASSAKLERSEEIYRKKVVNVQRQTEGIKNHPAGWEPFPVQGAKSHPSQTVGSPPFRPVPVQPFVGGRQRQVNKTEESTRSRLQKHNQILQKHNQILQETVAKQQSQSVVNSAQQYSTSSQSKGQNYRGTNQSAAEAKERYNWQYPEGSRYARSQKEEQQWQQQSDWRRKEETKTTRTSTEDRRKEIRSSSSEWGQAYHGLEASEVQSGEGKNRNELVRVYARGNVIQLSLEYDDGEEFRRTHPRVETRSQGETSALRGDSPSTLYAPRSSLGVKKNSDPVLSSQSEESTSESEDSPDHVLFGAFQPYQHGTFKHPNGTVYTPKSKSIGEPAKNRQYAIMKRSEFEVTNENATDTLVASVTTKQVTTPEIVYYAICTHYFMPELHDNVSNLHRRGKIVVPSGLDHVDTCIFYNHLYILEEEEVYVDKLVSQNEDVFVAQEEPATESYNQMLFETSSTISGSSHSSQRSHSLPRRHRNPFTSLKGEMMYSTLGGVSDNNNNNDDLFYGLEKSFGTSYETLRHKKRSINDEILSTISRYTPTSQLDADKEADRHLSLSRPRLLRKSPDFPGVSREVEDDYPKWRPKTPDAADRQYGISLGLVQ